MAATIDADVVHGFIELGDLEGLQAFAPPKFDWTKGLGEWELPALICVIRYNVARTEAFQKKSLKMVEWLLKVGADPRQKLPAHHPLRSQCFKPSNEEATKFTVAYGGHSAVSLAFAYLQQMQKCTGKADWSQMEAYLKAVLAVLSSSATVNSSYGADVTVPQSTLDLWESMRDLTTSHSVIFECSDGKVSAHDQILMLASPVLKAMLTSAMKEGSSWLIQVKDSSSSGVSLFLDLLYTSSTREDPDHSTMLEALDLAHRWQIHGVAQTLCRALCDMIDAKSFAAIAEAAALKGVEVLQRKCVSFGSTNEQVQELLKKGSLPAAVRKLLGGPEPAIDVEQPPKKRRLFR
ncbi:unnamed protein product [Symbiodinium sp. CCMP2456]|nr:unnamed protein product [Symbiodinium sp. CCMP2456]